MFDGEPQNEKKDIISRCGSAVLDSKCFKEETRKNTLGTVWKKHLQFLRVQNLLYLLYMQQEKSSC